MKWMNASEAGKLYIRPGSKENGGNLSRTHSSCLVQWTIVRRPFVWICTGIQQLHNTVGVPRSDSVNQFSGNSWPNKKNCDDWRKAKY